MSVTRSDTEDLAIFCRFFGLLHLWHDLAHDLFNVCDTDDLITWRQLFLLAATGCHQHGSLKIKKNKKRWHNSNNNQHSHNTQQQPNGNPTVQWRRNSVCVRGTCLNVQNAGNEPRLVTLSKMNQCTITSTWNGGALWNVHHVPTCGTYVFTASPPGNI